ncbi:hypothetical protein ACWDA3_27945 [Nonomuraea rubra]
MAWLLVPFVLLWALVRMPAWINDFRLARMVERVEEYPRLPGTSPGSFDTQVQIGGDSGDCWYTIRFDLNVHLSVEQVLNYYRQAKIEDPDGDLGDYSVSAWAVVDEPGDEAEAASSPGSLIIDLDGTFNGGLMDLRCL